MRLREDCMPKKNMERKGVVFNLDDPDQLELFNHAMKRSNFSAYVKRLIQRDKEGRWIAEEQIEVEEEEKDMVTEDVLAGFI